MTDEQFSRAWLDGHTRFTADLDRALRLVTGALRREIECRLGIGRPYGAANRIIVAVLSTSATFAGVGALAFPDMVAIA